MPHESDMPHQTRRRLLSMGLTAAGLGAGLGTAGRLITPAHAQAPVKLPEMTSIPEKLKGTGELRVVGFGGSMETAQKQAYLEPFERLSGIKVNSMAGSDINKIKAMVETGNVDWDVVQTGRASVQSLQRLGEYFEKIDYELVDTANIDPVYVYDYSLDMLVWSEVMAYRTDAFKGAVPSGWADFWDTKKFPGDRTMIGGVQNFPDLEFALMAAGVPIDKVYPIDIDKAFASLDRIKPNVVKWWETGAVPVQMLTDSEVVLATVWNGRMVALQQAGVPAAISWNQGLLKRDVWAVPKNAKNRANAMKFIAFSTLPVPQARLSSLITYGFVNNKAAEYVAADQLAKLPSSPDIKSKLLPYDSQWWLDNKDKVIARWNKWVLA